MTECRTPEMQDLLPDYLSASLDAAAAASVERHLAICDPCRDDLAVLRLARAVRPRTRPVDVAQIVATLPRPTPTLRLVRTASDAAPPAAFTGNVGGRSHARRRWSASGWQIAAAVGVMIVGGTSLVVSRISPGILTGARSNDAQLAEAAESALARTPAVAGTTPSASVAALDSPAGIGSARRASRVSVSYGDLGDYSGAELQRMLDRLEKWDGTSSTEPLPTLPVLSTSGGSPR
jgi:Putative zinc-finger